ncbi:hypothetical protein HYW74_01750 [Candidatus Pacearchaeota archaeon]|nr:hypothetical protein [Candidatus Pacearchaeota archaeon]
MRRKIIILNSQEELFHLARSGKLSVGDWVMYDHKFKEKVVHVCGLDKNKGHLAGIRTLTEISERFDSTSYKVREKFCLEDGTVQCNRYLANSISAERYLKELRRAI